MSVRGGVMLGIEGRGLGEMRGGFEAFEGLEERHLDGWRLARVVLYMRMIRSFYSEGLARMDGLWMA